MIAKPPRFAGLVLLHSFMSKIPDFSLRPLISITLTHDMARTSGSPIVEVKPINKPAMTNSQTNLEDVALSLCALGRGNSGGSSDGENHHDEFKNNRKLNPNAAHESAAAASSSTVATNNPTASSMALMNNNSVVSSTPFTPATADMNRLKISDHVPSPKAPAPKPKEVVARKRGSSSKYNIKPKDPKRDTAISFDEMKRLMRVYGSLKCLRNRTPKDSGKTVKLESIKRKFYRWFPDFEERFEKTPEGWYQPKIGHEHEMRYREEMRKQDQQVLVKKRNSRRESKLVASNLL